MTNSSARSEQFFTALGVKRLKDNSKTRSLETDLSLVETFITKQDKILDLGCGYGRLTLPLAKNDYDITGLDNCRPLLIQAKKDALGSKADVAYILGDLLKLPFKSKSFDKIICMWNTFHHLLTKEDQKKALAEMFRVLNDKGVVLIEVDDGDEPPGKEFLKKGYGPDKRLVDYDAEGNTLTAYLYNKKLLTALGKTSRFHENAVYPMKINGRDELLWVLEK